MGWKQRDLGLLRKRAEYNSYISCRKKELAYPHFYNLDSEITWENILSKAESIINKTETSSATAGSDKDFVGVSVHNFLALPSTKIDCDVYMRMKKEDGQFNFLKRYNANDEFDLAEIEKYRAQGLKEFFIKKEKFKYFESLIKKELVTTLEDDLLGGQERIKVTTQVYELTHDRLLSMGVDEHTIEVVNQSVKSMHASLGEDNAMATFLRTLKENNLSYAYAHSYLACLILHKIVAKFDWESGQIREKLTYIAYFHDISLPDEQMMKIHSQSDLDESFYEVKEKGIISNHAMQSAKIVEKIPKVPSGVTTVIKEHHGSKGGIGFMDDLSTSISPLSQMFIVVEDFVDSLLKVPQPASGAHIAQIMKQLSARYSSGTYNQALRAVEGMLLNKK